MTIVAPPDLPPQHGDTPPLARPAPVSVRLRAPSREGLAEHFAPSDPPPAWDLTRNPRVARLIRNRKFQFFLILPNQIIFWTVIFLGILGTVVPGLNFATAITWYIWFCLVFVLMVVVGRGWCAMCPFGGFAEWLQRRTFWQRTQKTLGLGRKLPEPIARYGLLLSVATFVVLTWIEERFNIAGPGNPADTGLMVIGIVASAVAVFLVFERRTFCRYLCPLTALIGSVGAVGSAAGFRTRDRDVCVSCQTKECMRGGDEGYGCPWYTWPGSADSNLSCGLCSECFKGCPSGNVGLFVQPPLTSVIAPQRRRGDLAWSVMFLLGLVVYQQINATNGYATLDSWLNRVTHIGPYPNPVGYLALIIGIGFMVAGVAWVASRLVMTDPETMPQADQLAAAARSRSFVDRAGQFRSFFVPVAYGLIPVVGSDFLARQLPKFFKHSLRIVPAIGSWFGAGSTHSTLYHTQILTDPQIVIAQLVVIGVGMAASLWATHKIALRDIRPAAAHPLAAEMVGISMVAATAIAAGFLYVIMHAAS